MFSRNRNVSDKIIFSKITSELQVLQNILSESYELKPNNSGEFNEGTVYKVVDWVKRNQQKKVKRSRASIRGKAFLPLILKR